MLAVLVPLPFIHLPGLGSFCAIGGAFWLVGMATFLVGTTITKWRDAR